MLVFRSLFKRFPVHKPKPVIFRVCQQFYQLNQVLKQYQSYLLPTYWGHIEMVQVLDQVVHKPTIVQLVYHNSVVYGHQFLLKLILCFLNLFGLVTGWCILIMGSQVCGRWVDWGWKSCLVTSIVVLNVRLGEDLFWDWFLAFCHQAWVNAPLSILRRTFQLLYYLVLIFAFYRW